MAITQVDQAASTKAGYNRYALAIMLTALDDAADMVAIRNVSWELAFSEFFTPSRDMHRVAKIAGLKLDVKKGQWIFG